jgi:hypothetical protein
MTTPAGLRRRLLAHAAASGNARLHSGQRRRASWRGEHDSQRSRAQREQSVLARTSGW